MYLNFSQNFCPHGGPSEGGNSAAPGECYYYLNFSRYKIGILLHLAGVLPASLLAVVQCMYLLPSAFNIKVMRSNKVQSHHSSDTAGS